VYMWEDIQKNMFYIGSHKGSINDGYICSQPLMNEEYNNRPFDFVRTILDTGTTESMRKFESDLLHYYNAALNPMFYNKHNGGDKFICTGHSPETIDKMRKAKSGKNNPMYGKKRPDTSEINKQRKGYKIKNPRTAEANEKMIKTKILNGTISNVGKGTRESALKAWEKRRANGTDKWGNKNADV